MDDAKFAELGQRQAQLAGKTEDGKMVAFVSEDPTNSFSIIVAEGPEWYAIDCEVFRYGGLPFPADALANVLSAMVSASGEMKIVGGATLEAQAGTMLVRNSYNFAIWGALPQPGTVLTLEIANDTFAFDVTTSIPKAQ